MKDKHYWTVIKNVQVRFYKIFKNVASGMYYVPYTYNFLDNIIHCQRHGSTTSAITEQLVTEATVEVHMPRDA